MIKSIVLYVTLLFAQGIFSLQAFSQNAAINGMLKDAESYEALEGATLFLPEINKGASTNHLGLFVMTNIPAGNYTLKVSLIGYEEFEMPVNIQPNDSVQLNIVLTPSHVEEEEVVVTATRTVRNIADVPVRVEAIPQEEIEEKLLMTPSSVAMLLNESTGMRVQTTSATSSAANLRIQGMSGRYTQLLTDGIPSFGGLSAGLSLSQLPPLNLRQVEVVKGAVSSLYGADAIAGVVNFITKEPNENGEITALVNQTTQQGSDIAGFYSKQFERFGTTMLISKNYQKIFDVDKDGFADVAEYNRWTFVPKFTYKISDQWSGKFSAGYTSEERIGGTMPSTSLGTSYTEIIKSKRIDASAQLIYVNSALESFSIKAAGMKFISDNQLGNNPFNAIQTNMYIDAQYSIGIHDHSLLIGSAFSSDDFDNRTPNAQVSNGYFHNDAGLFVQDEWKISEQWTSLVSGRLDHHNELGFFVTPRISLMYRPNTELTFRLGGGTGFKAPSIFIDETAETGYHRVQLKNQLNAERSRSLSFDMNWRSLMGEIGITVNTAFYATALYDALILDLVPVNGNFIVRNATGLTKSQGGEFSCKLAYDDFKVSLGYTYLFATQQDNSNEYELSLNPRHSVGIILFWENSEAKAKIGFENYWVSSQRLEGNPWRDQSPSYWITGLVAEKGFGIVRLFVNFENIFDTRQTKFEPIIDTTLPPGIIQTLPIYAPLEGRVINGGIRITI